MSKHHQRTESNCTAGQQGQRRARTTKTRKKATGKYGRKQARTELETETETKTGAKTVGQQGHQRKNDTSLEHSRRKTQKKREDE